MLDTFAKQLNFLGYPSGGAISEGDRHAFLGLTPPDRSYSGAIVATLGALAANFAGTVTAPPSAGWTAADRHHALGLTYGANGLDIYERYQQLGLFLFEGDGSIGGRINATLGALTASLRGTNSSLAVNGRVAANLGSLTASLRGEAYYDHFFDVDYSITPAFTPTVLTASSGQIAATLGALTASLRGQALPPNSSNGQILATLGALTSSLLGTVTAAAARDGKIKGDLGALTASLRGASVPPQSNVGAIQATLGALTASFVGTTVVPHYSGRIAATLGPLAGRFYGQALLPGTIYGLINANLGPLTSSVKGSSTIAVTTKTITVVARRRSTEFVRDRRVLTFTPEDRNG